MIMNTYIKLSQNLSIKRIIILGPSVKLGGMERASVNLANSLVGKIDEITYVSLFNQDKFFTLDGSIEFFEPDKFNKTSFSLLRSLVWIRKIVTRKKPEIIIVFNKFYSAVTLLALIFRRDKIIISERSSPDYQWPFMLNMFNNVIFKCLKPSGVMAQTKYALEKQKIYYGPGISYKVIPNSLPEISLHLQKREKIILLAGRLNDTLKGFDRFFDALKFIDLGNWKVIFAGGYLEDDQKLFDKYSCIATEKNITFLGPISDMSAIYNKSSIFVIPSRSEGFPNALNEAMAYGLACVSFDFNAGPGDLIVHGVSGILVKDGNIQALAQSIKDLMADDKLRESLGSEAIKNSYKYSPQYIGNIVVEFSEEVLHGK